MRSGRPIDVRVGNDLNQDTVNNDRPYLAPGISFPRNAFRNLRQYNVDMRLQKRFQIRENMRLSLSVEAFNIFMANNLQLGGAAVTNYCTPNPSTATSTCGFSAPTNLNFLSTIDNVQTSSRFGKLLVTNTAGDPFQMQFAARFQF